MKDLKEISVYTDGSYHQQKKPGAWVAILLHEEEPFVLKGLVKSSTNNRMELTAVIRAIEHILDKAGGGIIINIFPDSQYVMGLPAREQKLTKTHFITSKGRLLQNTDLLKILFALLKTQPVNLNKVKSHRQKTGSINFNTEADKLARSMVRAAAE